jgi:hypothetical protein
MECSFLYQHRFREFGSTFNRPHNRFLGLKRGVGKQFTDVSFMNRVSHGGVMVWAGIKLWTTDMIAFYQYTFECTKTLI